MKYWRKNQKLFEFESFILNHVSILKYVYHILINLISQKHTVCDTFESYI